MKYTPSALGVGQLSGSAGSITASHNRYGSYLRNRVIPVNPNSTTQSLIRGRFGALAQAWRTLTESQREGWRNLSTQVPILNAQGNSIILAGNAFFNKLNLNRLTHGFARIDDAPALDSPPQITALSFVATAATATIAMSYLAVGAAVTTRWQISASAPRSPGQDFVNRGSLKRIASFPGNEATPIALGTLYAVVFGTGWTLQVGMEIVIELSGMSANGFVTEPVQRQSIIVA